MLSQAILRGEGEEEEKRKSKMREYYEVFSYV